MRKVFTGMFACAVLMAASQPVIGQNRGSAGPEQLFERLSNAPAMQLNGKEVSCSYLAAAVSQSATSGSSNFDRRPFSAYDPEEIASVGKTVTDCVSLAQSAGNVRTDNPTFDSEFRHLRETIEGASKRLSYLNASMKEVADAKATATKAQADAAANTAAVNAPPPAGAFCFASMWDNPERGFPLPVKEPGIRTCIPSKNAFIGEPPFIVSELSLASPGDQLGRCKTMMPVQGEAQGIVGHVRLTCEVNGTAFNTEIRWTAEKFILSEMSVYICGPGTSLPGSEFEKTLVERFGSPAVSEQDRYVFAKDSYSLLVGGAPITENAGAAAVKRCPPDTRLWKFEMIAYRQNDGRRPPFGLQQKFTPAPHYADFEQHVLEKLKGQNTKFEKF